MAPTKRTISQVEHEDDEWEIEAILEHRRGKMLMEYKIKWKGSNEITWEPRSNITNGEDVLAEYWAQTIMANEDPAKFSQQHFLELGPWYKSLIVKVGQTADECEDLTQSYTRIITDLSNFSESDRAFIVGLQRCVLDIENKLKPREPPRAVVKIAKRRLTKNSNRSDPILVDQPLMEECNNDDQSQLDLNNSPDRDQADDVAETVSSPLETLAFPCKFNGCKKSFSTNKGRLDHGRYHRVVFCKEISCKWKGPVKRFNQHFRDSHAEIFNKGGINDARKKAGLNPTT